jgi:hypothetical protein
MKQKNRTQTRFRSQIRTYLVQERHTTSSLTQGGSLKLLVPQQHLDHTDILLLFEQVGGKTVPHIYPAI